MNVSRDDIQRVMSEALVTADTIEGRNDQRRAAVEEFLQYVPNSAGTQGRTHDMILSDLGSYAAWEHEDAQELRNKPLVATRPELPKEGVVLRNDRGS